jgi:hypothetical protein
MSACLNSKNENRIFLTRFFNIVQRLINLTCYHLGQILLIVGAGLQFG